MYSDRTDLAALSTSTASPPELSPARANYCSLLPHVGRLGPRAFSGILPIIIAYESAAVPPGRP